MIPKHTHVMLRWRNSLHFSPWLFADICCWYPLEGFGVSESTLSISHYMAPLWYMFCFCWSCCHFAALLWYLCHCHHYCCQHSPWTHSPIYFGTTKINFPASFWWVNLTTSLCLYSYVLLCPLFQYYPLLKKYLTLTCFSLQSENIPTFCG